MHLISSHGSSSQKVEPSCLSANSAILTKRYDTYHIYINKLQAMYHIYDKLKKEYFTYIMYTAGRENIYENIYENIEKCKKSSSHSSPRCDFEIDFHVLEQDLAARKTISFRF